MDGVILYVDDKIDEAHANDGQIERSDENALFEALREKYPVLGVKNLDLASQAVRSVGTFSAIILDWVFSEEEKALLKPGELEDDLKGVRVPANAASRTVDFLRENDFYSLIYVYSNEDVAERHGEALTEKFGQRIAFRKKGELKNPAEEIIAEIAKWKETNANLAIPLQWSAAINQSTQQIFTELSEADPDWIGEIYQSAVADGVSPDAFVIELFQSLLYENLVQSAPLLTGIREFGEAFNKKQGENEESITKLFRRLLYTKLVEDAPIMTGDICAISEGRFGVIITPECDIRRICGAETNNFELLVFERGAFDEHISKTRAAKDDGNPQNFTRARYAAWEEGTDSQKQQLDALRKAFNQNEPRFHLLPSFPFDEGLKEAAVIEFSLGAEMHPAKALSGYHRPFKLNAPFIQQLRQRYLAYLGRVGTPSLPLSLRNYNLKT